MSAAPALDIEFIKPFISGTKEMLATMIQVKATVGKAYLLPAGDRITSDIVGVIDVTSEQFRGTITLCFKAPVFLGIYEKLTGEVHAAIIPELEDAAAELVNMIYGQAKTLLNATGRFKLPTILPKILVGERIGSQNLMTAPTIILPFDSAVGSFHLEIVSEKV